MELRKINDFIEKTREEHDLKYGCNCKEIEIEFIVKFLDKIKNRTKNISTKSIKKSIIASQKRYELFEINKIINIIEGIIKKML